MQYDVFISHSSVDKETVARPLAEALKQRGISVWLDEEHLQIGDSIRRGIDEALLSSRFGVVILSPDYLESEWTRKELDAFFSKEKQYSKTILPIFHGLKLADIEHFSPMLADKIALTTDDNIETLANGIQRRIQASFYTLPSKYQSKKTFIRFPNTNMQWLIATTIALAAIAIPTWLRSIPIPTSSQQIDHLEEDFAPIHDFFSSIPKTLEKSGFEKMEARMEAKHFSLEVIITKSFAKRDSNIKEKNIEIDADGKSSTNTDNTDDTDQQRDGYDSNTKDKNVEIGADGKSSTIIVNIGDGKVIGKTGNLIKQIAAPSKKSDKGYRNSSISASENLTIKATNHGTVIVLTGDGTVVYEANKEAVDKLGVAQKSLASFFAIMQVEDVPVTDWESKLGEIAESFKGLKDKLASIQTSDKNIIALKQQADEAIDNGQFIKARELLDKAEQQAIDSHVENRLLTAAEIAATKGALAQTQLQYELMGEAYEDAANKIAALGEQHHEKWSEYLTWAGRGFEDAGLYPKAEPQYDKALALREKHLSKGHTDIALSLNNLANLYRRQGRYEGAEPLYQRSLDIQEEKLGKDHPDVATTLNNLAGLYRQQGHYEDAEPLYQRSLDIREEKLGKNHPDVATTLNNLAGLYRQQGHYEDTELLYQRSLAISEKTLGKNHPSVATTLNNLAALYESQGRYENAEPLFQRSLAISEKALGKDHPSVATTLSNLAGLYESQGRYEEAEPLYQHSLAISEKTLGKDHPSVATTLNNLAGLYRQQGRYEEAEPLYQRSLAISEKARGKDHPSVATTLNNLGSLSFNQGKLEQATAYLERALTIIKKTFGDDHPNVKTMQANLDYVRQQAKQ